MAQVYKYLTGMKFRQRVEAVIEKFNDMREDLWFVGKQRSKREAQILAVVDFTVGMVGDLQGIAGNSMPEIPSLDTPLLEASTDFGSERYRDCVVGQSWRQITKRALGGELFLGNSAIPSRSMPDKNFQTAPCGSGRTKRTKRTKRGLIATPVNATLGVDLILPSPLGTILSPLSPFLSAGYGQKIILGSGSALPGVKDQRQNG